MTVVGVASVELSDLGLADAGVLSDEVLLVERAMLERERRERDAREAVLLAELDRRGVAKREYGLLTGSLLAREERLPIGECRSRVHGARLLDSYFPLVLAELAVGGMAWAHVEVLVGVCNERNTDQLAEFSVPIVELARTESFARWRDTVSALAKLLDEDGPGDGDLEANEVFLTPLFDGTYDLSGRLVGDRGAAAHEVLERETERLLGQFTEDHTTTGGAVTVPPRKTLRALALVELLTRGAAAAHPNDPAVDLTLVLHMNEQHTNACDEGCDSDHDHVEREEAWFEPSSPHPDLPADLAHDRFRTLDGTILRGATMMHRLCDCAHQVLAMDHHGVPLDLGRTARFANRAQRRAAMGRDGECCIWAGCTRKISFNQMHHVQWWNNDGPTNMGNLGGLCPIHHWITHQPGWHMYTTNDQWFWWETPTGHTFWSQRHGQPRAGPPPPPRGSP